MVRSVLTLTPKRGAHDRVMAYYENRGILRRAVGAAGCTSAEIQLRLPERDAVVVTAVWASRSDYTDWVQSGERADDVNELLALLDGEPLALDDAELYEVVDAVDARHGEEQKP